jgi:hypothetical protein
MFDFMQPLAAPRAACRFWLGDTAR